jgi:hypothetical protein
MDEKARYAPMDYGPIGAAVKAAMPYTEADAVGVHAGVLALFSAAINGHVVQPSGRPVVCWTVLAGRSMSARKGTAYKVARHLCHDALGDFLRTRVKGGISSGPTLVQTLADLEEASFELEGSTDGRAIIVDQEWPTTLVLTNRCPKYSGVIRSSWDGEPISNVTKKDGKRVEVSVEVPALGFHAHIQPALWGKYVRPIDALGGTYNRFLPVSVRRSKTLRLSPGEPDPLTNVKVSSSLRLAYEWAQKERRQMTLSQEAADLYNDLREEYEDAFSEMPEDLTCYFERAEEQILRVACVLVAAERKTVISARAIKAAHAFVEFSIQSVKKLVSDSKSVQTARTAIPLDEKIRAKLELYGELNSTMLYRKLGSGRYTPAQIRDTAERMPDVEVEDVITSRPGSNPTYFRLKPLDEVKEMEAEPVTVPAPRKAAAKKTTARKSATKAAASGTAAKKVATPRKAVKATQPRKAAAAKKATAKKTTASKPSE